MGKTLTNWLALLLIPALVLTNAPACRADAGAALWKALKTIAGRNPEDAWGAAFVQRAGDWMEADPVVGIAAETAETTDSEAMATVTRLARELLVRKLNDALAGGRYSLTEVAGLYSFATLQYSSDRSALARYLPLRQKLSRAYFRDQESHRILAAHFHSLIDWSWLASQFSDLPLDKQMRLFTIAILQELDALNHFEIDEVKDMWEQLAPKISTPEAKAAFESAFESAATWVNATSSEDFSLSTYTREHKRLQLFAQELEGYFPEDSYLALKLKLFNRVDRADAAGKIWSKSHETASYAAFFAEPETPALVRRYFRAILASTNHALALDIFDPTYTRFIGNLDFDQVFKGEPDLRKKVVFGLLQALLARYDSFGTDLTLLRMWDRVIAATIPQYNPETRDRLKAYYTVYLKLGADTKFDKTTITDPAEVSRLRVQHLQLVERVVLLAPDIAGVSAMKIDEKALGIGNREGGVKFDRSDWTVEENGKMCNNAMHDQN